jgi:hypothetical protein
MKVLGERWFSFIDTVALNIEHNIWIDVASFLEATGSLVTADPTNPDIIHTLEMSYTDRRLKPIGGPMAVRDDLQPPYPVGGRL